MNAVAKASEKRTTAVPSLKRLSPTILDFKDSGRGVRFSASAATTASVGLIITPKRKQIAKGQGPRVSKEVKKKVEQKTCNTGG